MKDNFPGNASRRQFGPATDWFRVSPHATNVLPARPIFLRVNDVGSGTVLRIQTLSDPNDSASTVLSDLTLTVAAGEVINCRPHRIHSDTTATVDAFW